MNKLEKLKQWAYENVDSLGEEVLEIVDKQIKLWSDKKQPTKKDLEHIKETIENVQMDLEKVQSKAEFIMAFALLKQKIVFSMQYPIGVYETADGKTKARYYLDFLIEDYLNVEIDGEVWHDKDRDAFRDRYLKKLGYQVMRFPVSQVYFDVESIVDEIQKTLGKN